MELISCARFLYSTLTLMRKPMLAAKEDICKHLHSFWWMVHTTGMNHKSNYFGSWCPRIADHEPHRQRFWIVYEAWGDCSRLRTVLLYDFWIDSPALKMKEECVTTVEDSGAIKSESRDCEFIYMHADGEEDSRYFCIHVSFEALRKREQ